MNSTLDPRNFAYVTLLSSEDYIDAVLVLNESLKMVNAQYPLVCAVTNNLNKTELITRLIAAGIRIEWIEPLEYSVHVRENNVGHAVLNTASKINLFNLKNYDKLCYIDADVIVMKNIDDVFDYLDGAMIHTPDDYGFTGLFVFSPRNHREDFYLHLLTSFDCFDGDLIGSLWFYTRTSPAHQIPQSYCQHYHEGITKKDMRDTKVWHFCNRGNKPWFEKDRSQMHSTLVLTKYDELLQRVRN